MTRSTINNPPIHQEIPDKIQGITVKLKAKNQGFNAQIKQALTLFKNLKKDNIVIEDTLFKSKLVGDFGFLYGGTLSVQEFFIKLDVDDYLSLGSKVQYYVADDKLYICSIETAKHRLIEWWTNLTTAEKAAYNKTAINNNGWSLEPAIYYL